MIYDFVHIPFTALKYCRNSIIEVLQQLTEQERYRLNNDLLQLSRRTSGDEQTDFCTAKGVDATLFITKQVVIKSLQIDVA